MIELIKDLFKGFHLIHGVLILIAGVFNLWFWSRRRFWVPKYVHVITGISFAIAFFLGWMGYSLSEISIQQKAKIMWILITILFPTIVYFVFVFLGGVEATYRRRFPRANQEEGNNDNSNQIS
jgi:phosphotransferase system  glucose/maltose/N-acetylglucosamine-specific IIC component